MISDNLGIYNSYKRAKAMDEVRSTPFSSPQVNNSPEMGGDEETKKFTPEDHKRYNELRRRMSIKRR